MHLHHDKHHLAYVNGLNAALAALAVARAEHNFDDIAKLEQQIAFHGSGHVNHVLFWHNMQPTGQAKPQPTGELLRQIERDFGSYDTLRAQLQAATVKVEGNGWGMLAWHPLLGKLVTLALLNHQNAQLTGAVPLLLCDVWEHAYYLKYQNRRADFVTAWWNVVDWADVEARFEAARALRI
jgi:Fe-Mn family superoxide dismutase